MAETTTPAFGPWLRGRLLARGLKMNALEDHGVSERLLREIFKGAVLSDRTIACIRAYLAREDPAALSEFEIHVEGPAILRSFCELENALRKIDDLVITTLRSFEEKLMPHTAAGRTAAHHALIDEGLRKLGFSSLENFLQLLSRKPVLAGLVTTLPKPAISVQVAPTMAQGKITLLSYNLPDLPPVTLANAALLWGDARLVGQIRSQIQQAFFRGPAEIRWGEMPFRWRYSPALWPPSIDSFLFVDTLRCWHQPSFNPKSLVDIGSGTGFLGIVLRQHWSTVRSVSFYDWLLTPILYSAVNWTLNEPKPPRSNPSEVHFHCGFRLEDLCGVKSGAFDVAICNPPYLPMHGEHQRLSLEQTTSGTELLVDVLRHASRLGRNVFVQYSNLANSDVSSAKLAICARPMGKTTKVAFRIHKAIDHPEYLSFLETCGLQKDSQGYFHWLQAYDVGNWVHT